MLKVGPRGRAVTLAAIATLGVRLAGLAINLIAMPIALHSLGLPRFSAFLVLLAFVNWLSLGSFGVQSGLGKMLATHQVDDRSAPHALGVTLKYGMLLTLVMGAVVGLLAVGWASQHGAGFGLSRKELVGAALTMVVIAMGQVLLQTFEGVQIGRLTQHISQLSRLAGNLISLVALFVLPRFVPSIFAFVLALNGGQLIGALFNAVLVSRQARPVFRRAADAAPLPPGMWGSAACFGLIGIASNLQTTVPLLIATGVHSNSDVVLFGLLMRLLFAQMAILTVFTGPLWPSLLRAGVDGDYAWMTIGARRVGAICLLIGATAALAIGIAGDPIVRLWTKQSIAGSNPLLAHLFGIYFFQMAWSHVWGTMLMGLGRERVVALILVVEGVAVCTLSWLLAPRFGVIGVEVAMVGSLLAVSGWAFPFLVLTRWPNGRRSGLSISGAG